MGKTVSAEKVIQPALLPTSPLPETLGMENITMFPSQLLQ